MKGKSTNCRQFSLLRKSGLVLSIFAALAGLTLSLSVSQGVSAECPFYTAPGAQAVLRSPEGQEVGVVLFRKAADGVEIMVNIAGMEPGEHALHIHEKGSCIAPYFKSAGGHFNPYDTKHGFLNPQGPHAGDLPNFTVNESGKASFSIISNRLTLDKGRPNSLFKDGGTSVVIHQNPDDYITDPAGGGGARIACGVIEELE